MSETTLRNPTLAAVNAELARLAESANSGQRSRTATLQVAEGEWANDEFADFAGGEGVANSYRQRAATTIVSVAWVTDSSGDRHVRCYAARVNAPKSSYGRSQRHGFDMTATQWAKASIWSLALPWLSAILDAAPAFSIVDDDGGVNVEALLVACDWLDERGRLDLTGRVRQTFPLQFVTA